MQIALVFEQLRGNSLTNVSPRLAQRLKQAAGAGLFADLKRRPIVAEPRICAMHFHQEVRVKFVILGHSSEERSAVFLTACAGADKFEQRNRPLYARS